MESRRVPVSLFPLFISLLSGFPSLAAEREFTPDDIVAFKSIAAFTVSPDQKSVVVSLLSPNYEERRFDTDLWLVTLDGSSAPRQLTFSEGSENSPAWSPDGTRIAFLARRSESTEVHVLPVAGGEARPFAAVRGSAAAFAWSPDGKRMAVLAPPEESDAEARRRREGDDAHTLGEQWRNHRVWIVADNGSPRPLTDGQRHARSAEWSPDGRWIAAITTPNPEADAAEEARAEVIDVETGREREVPDSAQASSVRWSVEGLLLVTRPYDGRSISRQDVFAWTLNGPRAVNMTRVLDRDTEAVFSLGHGRIAVLHAAGTTSAVSTIDMATGAVVSTRETGAAVRDLAPAGDRWVMVGGDRPDELQLAEGGNARALTTWNTELASALTLPLVETVRWRSSLGQMEGVLYRPPQLAPGQRYPLIVNPHGGPRDRSTAAFDPQAAYFVSQGFFVFKPNFRGSSGYGDEFARASVENWGDGPYRDLMSGIEAMVLRGSADPMRLYFYGWSYGGYLANWAVTHGDQFRAIVSGAGVADLRMQYAISDARRWRFDYFTATPFVAPNLPLYERESPVTWARAAKTPVLFLHGDRDQRCPLPQGLMMHRALQDNGVKTEMVIYPREGHAFTEPRHIIDRARRIVAWFQEHDSGERRTGTTPGR